MGNEDRLIESVARAAMQAGPTTYATGTAAWYVAYYV